VNKREKKHFGFDGDIRFIREKKRRLKHHLIFRELPALVYGKLEWRLGGCKNKDGKGTQIGPFECTAEEGS
jgi:hypothetical protein